MAADHRFVIQDGTITYGPSPDAQDEWILGASTEEGERVELILNEDVMHDLWIEVQDIPWSRGGTEEGRLRAEVVDRLNLMGANALKQVLETANELVIDEE